MSQHTTRRFVTSLRLMIALLTVAVLAAGDRASHHAGQPAGRVASAQIAPPSPSPALPVQPVLVRQPAATNTPLTASPQSAATATPTPPTPITSPVPISPPSAAPGNPVGGPTAPTPTRGPGCVAADHNGGGDCPKPREPLTCDFDGDGFGDLAVGVPGEDYGRGGVNVQYNQGGFLNKPVFLQAKHAQGEKVTEGARFGAALACGDFNGDRVGDLAVGAPRTSFGGSVWILWGRTGTGLDASSYFEMHQTNGTIPGSTEGNFGHALAVGDFDRDDVDDLAIGDPYEPVPDSKYEFGMVVVVHGSKEGLQSGTKVQQLRGGRVLEGDVVRDFGWSLAAGPLVTGGGDDLVVGAPRTAWKGSGTSAGRAYLFRDHGGLVFHQAIDEVALASEGLPNANGKPEFQAQFGWALATGDFNGDGKLDLAIGIPGKSMAGVAEPGAVVVVPGNGVGVDFASEDYVMQDDVGGDSEPADAYGWSLAAGNWNVDQFDDLAVGNPFEDIEVVSGSPGVNRTGAVFVHYGSANLAFNTGLILRQGSGVTPGVPVENDWFGQSVASVRLGTVDLDFLVIGIPGERGAGLNPDCSLAGAVQLAISWANVGPIADPTYLLHQDTENPYDVADQRECTGSDAPLNMGYGEPLPDGPYGEFFGWATGS